MPWSTDDLKRLVDLESQLQNVDPRLSRAVVSQESEWNPNAVGNNGNSIGLFQLQPGAAKDAGLHPRFRSDPADNIKAGVTYLKQKLRQSGGNVEQALSRYNRGTPDYRGIGDPNYVQNVLKYYPDYQQPSSQHQQKPGMLSRVGQALSPSSAEAATPQAAPRSRLEELEAELARRDQQAAPQASGATPPAPSVSEAAPTPTTPPGASQGPGAPDTSWTPGMRFQALPSITQLEPAERTQRTQEFARLTPALQEEFLRSEEPASDLVVDIEKASTPPAQAPQVPSPAAAPGAPGVVRPVGLTKLTPDMDEDAIIWALGYDPAVIKKAPGYRPGVFKEGVTDPAGFEATILNSPVGGFARGAQDVAEGLVQLAARGGQKLGVVSPERVAFYEAMMKLAEANYQQNIRQGSKVDPQTGEAGIFSDPSRLVGQAAAVPIPGGAATTIPRVLARGALTGAVSGAVQPVQGTGAQPGSETDDFWTQKGWQTGTGGVLGGGLSLGVEKGLAPAINKGINWARGVIKPAYASIVETADKYGIRLTYGDITKGSVAPKVETVLQSLPLTGGGGVRVRGQKDVARVGDTLRTGLATEMQQTPWRNLAEVQQAASGGGSRAKDAQVLLAEISEAGDDWGRVIQTSGKLNLFNDRVRVEQLYNRVEELAQPLGNMRLPKATQAIDDAIARASDDVLPSPEVKREVIGALNRIKGEITPTAAQPRGAESVFDPRTNTWRAQPTIRSTIIPDTTYSRMRRLRSSLGDLQREAAEPATARYLSGVKTALEEDMAEFAAKSNVPGLSKAAKDADTFFRTRIVPYREGTLAKAIEKNLPDEIYNQFVRRGKDRAQYFYNGLDPKGQAAVRYGMVEEAVEKATGGEPGIFSPARFATSLKKIQDAHGVFFKGTPQWEINGLTNVMEHGKQFGQYMENPPTGLRGAFLGAMVGTGGLAAIPYAVKALTVGQGLRLMLMTQRGRNFLLTASDLQPGSPAFQRAFDRFMRQVPQAAALAGGAQADQPSQPSQ